jgi:hypothetical protein
MSTDHNFLSTESFPEEMQQLLRTASQHPWGPGREIDAKVHHLHQTLMEVGSRLGSAEEKPEDEKLAHTINHELRNKLMVYQYYALERARSAHTFGS